MSLITTHTINSLTELDSFAKKVLQEIPPLTVVLLNGQMGAGKTAFVTAFSKLCKFKRVSSPTFTLVNKYETNNGLIYHIDLYRLNSKADLYSMDILDYIDDPQGFVFIEWGEKLGDLNPTGTYYQMDFEWKSDTSRTIRVKKITS